MNLTGRPVYARGQKRKGRARPPQVGAPTALSHLIERARCKGKEREYLDWLMTQPSALSGQFSWDAGTPFCEPAHWRTARHAGTSQKPEYLAIPLTHLEHRQAHQHGDSTIGDRDWWERQCVLHLERWISS